ncbi:hypothetical protein V9T40_003720 [Parthenolecanium corni]|uniref:RCC1-like domain-containing protein n=1 Tax=Parthenolecanium corni TaxID=536013 RepID=A0AAN9TVL6_9HEMI
MNDIDVPEYGAVFTFGKSGFAENFPSHFFIRNDPIVEIACGQQHTAVVCENGRVFSFGNNEWGQLGLGHRESINKPSCIKSLKPDKVKHVACGRVHTIFTTENGKVYSCGRNTDGQLGIGDNETLDYAALPMFVTEIDDEIVQLTAGSHHSLLLTAKGTVYGWGSNANGQLVADKYETSVYVDPTPLKVPFFVTYISSNYYRSAFITDQKILYSCGDDDDDNEENMHTNPQNPLREAKVPGNIKSVACGHHHNVVLTDEGTCYTRGDNTFGQLGVENLSSSSQWLSVPFEDDVIINAISAGDNHSMFLTDTGILYACGDSRYGKLCTNNKTENVTKPTKIQFSISNLQVEKVVCGERHTMVMARPTSSENTLPTIEEIKNRRTEFSNMNETTRTKHSICEFDSSQEQDYFVDFSNSKDDRTYECKNGRVNGQNSTDENSSIHQLNDAKTNGISSKDSSDCIIREISTSYLQDSDEIQVGIPASSNDVR